MIEEKSYLRTLFEQILPSPNKSDAVKWKFRFAEKVIITGTPWRYY